MIMKVYYNQKCNICNIEISHYRKKNLKYIDWIDINTPSKDLELLGKSHKEMMRRLHVISQGKIYSGASAFIILWKNMPRYRLLSQFLNLPIIFHIFTMFYEIIALILYFKNNKNLNS